MPGFKIEIRDGRVSMEHIFRAKLWTSPPSRERNDLVTLTYQKLIQVAEETGAEAENVHCGV